MKKFLKLSVLALAIAIAAAMLTACPGKEGDNDGGGDKTGTVSGPILGTWVPDTIEIDMGEIGKASGPMSDINAMFKGLVREMMIAEGTPASMVDAMIDSIIGPMMSAMFTPLTALEIEFKANGTVVSNMDSVGDDFGKYRMDGNKVVPLNDNGTVMTDLDGGSLELVGGKLVMTTVDDDEDMPMTVKLTFKKK